MTISLPTAIPRPSPALHCCCLGAVWSAGPLLPQDMQILFTPYAIILANIFVTFPLAFGVIMPVLETMSRSLEEASATMGARAGKRSGM